jgi:hypothetical protein
LNCDDYLLPGALQSVASLAASHPEADLIHGDCVYVTEDDQLIRRKYDTPIDEWDLLFVGCIIPSTSTFIRSTVIQSGHLLDVNYRNCMDWEYYLRLLRENYNFRYLDEPLANFRWYDDSTTQKNWQRMIDEGLRCRRIHIKERGIPSIFSNETILQILRRIFQVRRIIKRLIQHGKFR